ncbi:hypothetical protein ACEQ8H_003386 [Pleosporales sp. CAS-2024a]
MPPGILWVSSRIINPDKLSASKFCEWYEDMHIQQVLSASGLRSAIQWTAVSAQPSGDALSAAAPWLTVYEMDEIEMQESGAFKAAALDLDGPSRPRAELVEGIFKHARFDTRVYALVSEFVGPRADLEKKRKKRKPDDEEEEEEKEEKPALTKEKATFLISGALEPPPDAVDDLDAWYRDEHLHVMARVPGYLRTRRFQLVSGTSLVGLERSTPEMPRFLSLHEFAGEGALPWKELLESVETEWAKKVLGGLLRSEMGYYECKRRYEEEEEEEWGTVGK